MRSICGDGFALVDHASSETQFHHANEGNSPMSGLDPAICGNNPTTFKETKSNSKGTQQKQKNSSSLQPSKSGTSHQHQQIFPHGKRSEL